MFKKIIRELRTQHGLTQKDIADKLKISRVAYTRYESGDREPDFATVEKISNIFSVSVDYLLGIKPKAKQNKPTVQVDSELNELLKDPLNAKLWETLKKLSQDDKEIILGLLKLKLNQQD